MTHKEAIRLLPASFTILMLALLFFSYPEAIFPPGLFFLTENYSSYSAFTRSVPAVEILTPLAIVILFRFRLNSGLPGLLPLFVILLSILLHSVFSQVTLEASLHFLGIAVIPCSVMILYRNGYIRIKPLCLVFSILWLQQVFWGIDSVFSGNKVIGIAGNRNWAAALLLATCPWAAYRFYTLLPARRVRAQRLFLTTVTIICPTLFLLTHCDSRGAWLSLLFLPILFYWLLMSSRRKKIAFCLTVVLLPLLILAGVSLLPQSRLAWIKKDVRPPLWSASLKLIKEHPLGVGPGNFQKYFAAYRTESGYNETVNATDSTLHPHNEPLNIAASIGIPGLLAFIFLISPLFKIEKGESAMLILSRCSAFTLLFHSLFDLILVQMPCSLMAFICIGILLSQVEKKEREPFLHTKLSFVWTSLAVAVSIFVLVRDTVHDHMTVRAHVQAAAGKPGLAYESMIQATAFKPENLEAFYQIASLVQFTDLADRDNLSVKHYERVFRKDPSYSHINLYLALAYLRTGEKNKVEERLLRELELFPLSVKAYPALYTLYYLTEDFDLLPDTYDLMINNMLRRRTLFFPAQKLVKLLSEWITLIEEGDETNSIRTARVLASGVIFDSVDPALHKMTELFAWPEFERTGVNALDFFYWKSRLRMFNWVEDNNIRERDFNNFLATFKENFEIVKGADYAPPGIALDEKKISPRAAIHLFTELLRLTGGEALFEKESDKTGSLRVFFKGEYHIIDTPQWTLSSHFSKYPSVSWKSGKTFVFLPVQSFYLRTQFFSSLLDRHFHDKNFLAASFPAVHILRAMELFPAPQKAGKLSDFLFSEEFSFFYNNLKNL